MSEELTTPDGFTSNLKLLPVVVWPERAFTPLISLELTDLVLFVSPTRKPIAEVAFVLSTGQCDAEALMLAVKGIRLFPNEIS